MKRVCMDRFSEHRDTILDECIDILKEEERLARELAKELERERDRRDCQEASRCFYEAIKGKR